MGLTLGATAGAHPREYINWSLGVGARPSLNTSCPPDSFDGLTGERQFGGAVLCAGDLVPNGLGQASMSLNDQVNNPSQATYCQDLNDDSFCGGNPSIPPPYPYGFDPLTGAAAEPTASFCGSVTLQSPLLLAYKMPSEWADAANFGGNWEPSVDTFVFLKGFAQGNAAYAPCGVDVTATPTNGFVVH